MGKSYWMSNQNGNFSNEKNDTFDPMNDYIGIRLQQGVPLLDRDWNELEDIRRYQEMVLRSWYIGDGTPNNGFKITYDSSKTTNVKISEGRYLVDGFEAVNNMDQADGPTLGDHLAGKYDLVYLDMWISEKPGPTNSQDVNMKTCIRHKIEYEVKVAANKDLQNDLDYLTIDLKEFLKGLEENKNQLYHHYSPLALLDRNNTGYDIAVDLRCIGNCAHITHSISHDKFSEVGGHYRPDASGSIDIISIPANVNNAINAITIEMPQDMIPYCPYRYIIWAEAEGTGPTPQNPAKSKLIFKRRFYNYGDGSVQDYQKDSKSIDIKTEYSFSRVNKYVSDLRPFRRGTNELDIENNGSSGVKIYAIGLIYYNLG